MRKFKKIASIIVAASMLTSSLAFTITANAAANNSGSQGVTQVTAQDASLQSNVQDGVILHAFNWSYNSIKSNLAAIADAGYTTVQTSPVQQSKDYGTSRDVAGQWWKLYQPVSMQIAQTGWLGSKAELTSLCAEAEKYGVKIICDIVSNHMGNDTEDDPNSLSTQVQTYQPDFYTNKSSYFRSNLLSPSDGNLQSIVQGHVSACPDINTGNSSVQTSVINLLKDCIDCGVDGFRFDAAKHIETPDDGSYASNYWPNVSGTAGTYYKQKTGNDLYIYGEILNTCGNGRSYSSYTKYINVTDNRTGDSVLNSVVNGNASSAASSSYRSGSNASDVVLWAESHDTYEGTSGSSGISNTASVSDENIVKAWAIVAARANATSLYFARPGAALMGDASTDVTYKSTAVSEVNKFHNKFVGQAESLGSSDGVAYVRRGTNGIVLSNCSGTTKTVSISGTGLANGSYTDTITGNKFNVSNGVLTGSIGSTGVAVVYNGTTTPRNTCSVESSSFEGETMTVTLGLENATSGTYCIDNSTPVSYTGTTTIRLGSDYNYGDTINLTLTATDGTKEKTTSYQYVKKEAASSGVFIFFNASRRTNWTAPFNVYIYDEDSSATTTYSNTTWPGQPMQYDEASGYYYVEVSSTTCLGKDVASGTVSETNYDLAHSANTHVIFSDSSNVNSAPRQYPADGSKTKLSPNGSSKLFCGTSTTSWADTDLVPSTGSQQPATDVTKGTGSAPTTAPTTVATTAPTTAPTTSSKTAYYGDADNSGKVNIIDATQVQKYSADLIDVSKINLTLADVSADGKVNIKDATLIQKYLIDSPDCGRAGQPYVAPTVPTTAAPTTIPTTAVPTTQPTTAAPTTVPASEYTFYFKTTLGWMTSDGVSLYVYDTKTGESYDLIKDEDAYPNVYTAQVPDTMTSCIVYRYLEPVTATPVGGTTGNVYNTWSANVTKTSNCVTLSAEEVVSTGPYVAEQKPAFELSRVYFDNSNTNWSQVYIYGWAESNLANTAVLMTRINGTNIWYYDFDEPLLPASTCFLFKNTATATWDQQTNNITVADGMNCYKSNAGSKTGGTWYNYSE